jgi:hypothetical protein
LWKKGESDYEVDDLQEVAVKSMKPGAKEEERTKFLQEAAIMGQFRNPYILRILGYMTGDPVSYLYFRSFSSETLNKRRACYMYIIISSSI